MESHIVFSVLILVSSLGSQEASAVDACWGLHWQPDLIDEAASRFEKTAALRIVGQASALQEFTTVMKAFAYTSPSSRFCFSVVLGGLNGCGKDALLEVVRQVAFQENSMCFVYVPLDSGSDWEVQERIARKLENLNTCCQRVMVVLSEVQHASPAVLRGLKPLFDPATKKIFINKHEITKPNSVLVVAITDWQLDGALSPETYAAMTNQESEAHLKQLMTNKFKGAMLAKPIVFAALSDTDLLKVAAVLLKVAVRQQAASVGCPKDFVRTIEIDPIATRAILSSAREKSPTVSGHEIRTEVDLKLPAIRRSIGGIKTKFEKQNCQSVFRGLPSCLEVRLRLRVDATFTVKLAQKV